MHETSEHKSSLFVTLTYSEEAMPIAGRLQKPDLQKFLKRLRKSYPEPIKYFACGEYGEKFGRPHYHLIIFNMYPQDEPIIKKAWDQGLIHIGSVTPHSARYVASYIQKKYYGDPTNRDSDLFQLQSQGIGLNWAKKNQKQIQNQQKITTQGVPGGVPRYYVKKLGLDLSESAAKRVAEIDEEYKARENDLNEHDASIFDISLLSKRQRDRNVQARIRVADKGKL